MADYRIPGYGGYVPGEKFEFGKSYAKIARVGWGEPEPMAEAFEPAIPYHRSGYTGYIPGSREVVGKPYAKMSQEYYDSRKQSRSPTHGQWDPNSITYASMHASKHGQKFNQHEQSAAITLEQKRRQEEEERQIQMQHMAEEQYRQQIMQQRIAEEEENKRRARSRDDSHMKRSATAPSLRKERKRRPKSAGVQRKSIRPHITPGYTGHVPMYQFDSLGSTYGDATRYAVAKRRFDQKQRHMRAANKGRQQRKAQQQRAWH